MNLIDSQVEIKLGDIRRRKVGIPAEIWHACIDCGRRRWVQLRRNLPISLRCRNCGCKHRPNKHLRGPNSNRWKGGRHKNLQGYIVVWLSSNDFFYPMTEKSTHYVREHRLIMAQYLGRCLHPWEIVHHKGKRYKGIKNRSDNLMDNLQLVTDDRHKQLTLLEERIKRLEAEIKAQYRQIKLLQWRIKELEQALCPKNSSGL